MALVDLVGWDIFADLSIVGSLSVLQVDMVGIAVVAEAEGMIAVVAEVAADIVAAVEVEDTLALRSRAVHELVLEGRRRLDRCIGQRCGLGKGRSVAGQVMLGTRHSRIVRALRADSGQDTILVLIPARTAAVAALATLSSVLTVVFSAILTTAV